MSLRAKIAGIALLGVALGSEALTLGRVQGAVLIGQGLNVVVPVQLDAGENAASLCFEADVFHADTRQDASRVRVRVEAMAQPDTAQVRILSSAVIDEPVVSVDLRTGCGQKTTRRYVLLVDVPSEVAALSVPSVPLLAPAATPVPRAVSSSPTASVSAVNASTARPPQRRTRPKVVDRRPEMTTARIASNRAPSDGATLAERSSGQSRLTLDPLEFLSDRIANLELAAPITAPQAVLQDQQKMQALEASVKTLRALTENNEASLTDLKARLQKAESSRFSAALVYGLIGLLLACLAALAWLWTRQRRVATGGGEWWSGANPVAAAAPAALPEREPAAERMELDPAHLSEKFDTPAFSESVPDSKPSSAVDVKLMDMSDSYFQALLQSGASDSAKRQAPPALAKARQPGLARNLEAEAILDIRQQAGFFVSLGQPEQAVLILKRQIQESEEPNPFVYLDLLGIVHSLGLKVEFQRMREEFKHLFKGRVPEFVFFTTEGRGLESYPEVLSRITALWPTPAALALLEACIFQDSPDASAQPFDLAAFRDLLLLHAIAPSAAPASPPLKNDPASALDLDLSDLQTGGLGSPPASLAEVDLPLSMPDDPAPARAGGAAAAPIDSGNLIDFDLPPAPTSPVSDADKSGTR